MFQYSLFKRHAIAQNIKDLVGIGIGPANLSLAALLEPKSKMRTAFFEQRKEFDWHPGMQISDAKLQVSYLKDLVTLVDPTNPYSFLNFLSQQNRLYEFITAGYPRILRTEFNQYLQWVAANLNNLYFGHRVCELKQINDYLRVTVEHQNHLTHYMTRNLVVGVGITPYVPEFAQSYMGEEVFHASRFLYQPQDYAEKRIAILGGGQTGAEVLLHYLENSEKLPAEIYWINRRDNFLPIDETPFVNDMFTPQYTEHFYGLPGVRKQQLIKENKLFSDGVSPKTLEAIYQRLYELRFIQNKTLIFHLLPGVNILSLSKNIREYNLILHTKNVKEDFSITIDKIVLCTGYRQQLPEFVQTMSPQFLRDSQGNLDLNMDYSIKWNAPCRIYMQNAALHTHGVADPNLSLMAWRSARIINSLLGKPVYSLEASGSLIDWQFANQNNSLKEVSHVQHLTV